MCRGVVDFTFQSMSTRRQSHRNFYSRFESCAQTQTTGLGHDVMYIYFFLFGARYRTENPVQFGFIYTTLSKVKNDPGHMRNNVIPRVRSTQALSQSAPLIW